MCEKYKCMFERKSKQLYILLKSKQLYISPKSKQLYILPKRKQVNVSSKGKQLYNVYMSDNCMYKRKAKYQLLRVKRLCYFIQ